MRNKWTIKNITMESQKYSSISEWRKNSFSSYTTACVLGILRELSKNMYRNTSFWTKDAVKIEALRYPSRVSWRWGSSGSYDAAVTNKWLVECSMHMVRPISSQLKWTEDKIFEEASKFSSRKEWYTNSRGSYKAAARLGILDKIPLGHCGGISEMEKELLGLIKKHYDSASHKRIKNVDKNLPFNWLELDIFIPELKKGIEFDGTYFHSVEGLKKSRPHLSNDIINNYHSIKDEYFNSFGIKVLHIKEKDWLKNKEQCVQRCLEFLGEQNGRHV